MRNSLYAHLCVDAPCVQDNILITPDGNACLGDFGIAPGFPNILLFKLGTIRYTAPERFNGVDGIGPASERSDVYSLAMTSLTVCSSFIGKPSDT